jgi:RNA polymerase sigma-70 factor (ECF subfamily)
MIVRLAEARDGSWPALGARDRESAFEEVYHEHADAIYRYCLALLADPAAAEDCAAETFANALHAYGRAELTPALVRPWLFRIARNTSIDWIRRDRVRRRFLAGARGPADPHDVESIVELRADLQAALDALHRLSERDRQLVGLRIAGRLTYREIASVLGMKENAARMATARALAQIRTEVNSGD